MRFRVLGPVQVQVADGRVLRLPRRHERCMLGVLLLAAGRTVPVERLTDLLWHGAAPRRPRAALSTYASRIRAMLAEAGPLDGEARLVSDRGGYLLDVPPDLVDAHRFRRLVGLAGETDDPSAREQVLREALALWRGPPLHDAAGDEVRRRLCADLEEMHVRAVEDSLAARLALGQHGAALPELAQLVREHPLREPFAEMLMVALYRLGRAGDALDAYSAARARLADELGLDPGPELRRLHLAILRGEPVAGADPGGPAPWEAPAGLADFVGRAKEINEMRTLLTDAADRLAPGTCPVVTVAGTAGVGKTTLAVRVAHEVRRHYPDGCLYADLHGTDAAPAPPETVLASFLRSFGMPAEAIPAGLDDRARLYRSILSGKRVLVVADNAADENQARPLIPGPGCGVIVTSRRLLAGLAGAHPIVAEPLPVQDAVRLLAKVAGPERITAPEQAERVVELCARLPLAIRIAGVRLVRRGDMTPGLLAERLADERGRLDELATGDLAVRASLELGYQRLDPDAARLLCLLGATSLPTVTAPLAAALLEAPEPRADRILEDLCAMHLLTSLSYDRYRMHDLVRLHARERAHDHESRESLSAAAERACRHLLVTARRANQRLPCRPIPVPFPGPQAHDSSAVDGPAWFEAERQNLVGAVGKAIDLGRVDLAGEIATAAANFWIMRGYLDEWEQTHLAVLDAAPDRREPGWPAPVEAAVRLSLATMHRFRDRNDEALPLLRRAYRLFRAAGDPLGAASAALSWAVCCEQRGRSRFARAAMGVVVALLESAAPAEPLRGYAFMTLRGSLAGSPEAERANLERALSIFDAAGERWGAAEAHTFLGYLLQRDGLLEPAAAHLDEAIAMYTELGDQLNAVVAANTLAETYLAMRADARARDLLAHTLSSARRLRHRWAEATALRLTAQLDLSDRRASDAVGKLEAAVSIFRQIGQAVALGKALDQLGRARLAVGDRAAAALAGGEAHTIFGRLDPGRAADVAAWMSAAGLAL